MAGAQISTSVSIIDNLKGYMALSLTEYNTSAAAAIAAGSVVEIAGAFFTFAADETPTGWTAITTGNTAYIALTASGTAGSQVVNAGYVSTAPTWRDDLQGWYASAASSVRIVASVYKAESTRYIPKYIFTNKQNDSPQSEKFLSVASSLSVGGDATISGDINISGSIVHGALDGTNTFSGISKTNGSIFSAFSTAIPNIGDTAMVCGGLNTSASEMSVISRAYKTSTTEVTLYGVYNNSGGTWGQFSRVCTSGSTTTVASIYITW